MSTSEIMRGHNFAQQPLLARTHSALPRPSDPGLGVILDPVDKSLSRKLFRAWAAVTGPEREAGLMFRESIPASTGLLFVFPTLHFWGMWMKNTTIPLDIVFLTRVDGRGREDEISARVVSVTEGIPHNETVVYPPMAVDMVLEVPAGTFAPPGYVADASTWKTRGVRGIHITGYDVAIVRAVAPASVVENASSGYESPF